MINHNERQPGLNGTVQGTDYQYRIPASVMFEKALSPQARLLYGVIAAMAQKTGYCWASSNTLSEYFGCTREAISRQINSLATKGFIRVEIRNKTNRKIFITDVTQKSQGCDETITRGVTEMSGSCDGKITQGNKKRKEKKYTPEGVMIE